jgi:hypothetical protein
LRPFSHYLDFAALLWYPFFTDSERMMDAEKFIVLLGICALRGHTGPALRIPVGEYAASSVLPKSNPA